MSILDVTGWRHQLDIPRPLEDNVPYTAVMLWHQIHQWFWAADIYDPMKNTYLKVTPQAYNCFHEQSSTGVTTHINCHQLYSE